LNVNPDAKAALRTEVRAHLKDLAAAERAAASRRAQELLTEQAVWKKAQTILLYAPAGEELDVWPLLKEVATAGKRAFLPRFDPGSGIYVAGEVGEAREHLRTGYFGVLEPTADRPQIPLNRLDLVLAPGVAFDLHGRRLGRGKGYYDRLLAAVRGKTCGVAFDVQIVAEIPVEPHDMLVNCLLTPTRWIEL
jgi:5-formyltetrahydrofolate cyclo-ligase